MQPTFKIEGAKEIANMFGDLPKQIKQYNLWKALWRKVGKDALEEAKSRVPKDTGRLRDSIRFLLQEEQRNLWVFILAHDIKECIKVKKNLGFMVLL